MHRIFLSTCVLSGSVLLGASSAAPTDIAMMSMAPKTASGAGHFRFGDDEKGRAMFDFSIDASGPDTVVRLYVGAEIEHEDAGTTMYPDYAIKLTQAETVKFQQHKVEFSGWGLLTGQLYHITVTAFDGEAKGQPDWFHIVAIPEGHGHLDDPTGPFEARGDVRIGDIVVGHD